MTIYNFVVLFFAFGAFLLGVLIYLKRQDELGIYYFAFSTSAAIWGTLFSFVISDGAQYGSALFLSRLNNMAAIFIPIFWFHITVILSGQSRKKSLTVFYVAAILVDAFGFTDWFIPDVKPIGDFKYYPQGGPLFVVYNIIFVVATILGFKELILKLSKSNKEEKIQLIGLMSATLAGFTAGMPTFLPCYGINFPQYGLFLMPIYPFCMAYFMMRKDLFSMTKFVEAAHKDKLAAIGTLATSINHEIRNPLYIIQGLSDSYLANVEEGIYKSDEEKSRKSQEIFKKTSQQATRAMEIMKSFAMFAKQNVNAQFKSELIDINQLVDSILPLVNHELELEKIKLIREISGNACINADRRHLEEILFNLIVNASQALKQNLQEIPQIHIRSEIKNQFVCIEINDNGPGIPSGQLSKVFEPFYTTKEEGTGLGLYVTRQLVEKNRGKIEIESQLGRGTSFILSFPVTPIKENRT